MTKEQLAELEIDLGIAQRKLARLEGEIDAQQEEVSRLEKIIEEHKEREKRIAAGLPQLELQFLTCLSDISDLTGAERDAIETYLANEEDMNLPRIRQICLNHSAGIPWEFMPPVPKFKQ